MGDITNLIHRARAGESDAVGGLFDALYPELRRIAHARLSRNVRDTLLDTTALVHECFMKLAGASRVQAADRGHFLAYAASTMRSVVVDFARARAAERRGGGAAQLTLNTAIVDGTPAGEDEILRVHDALADIGRLDARLVQVVEMRYFGGMTDEEIAATLGITDRTVRRDWNKARLLLAEALRQ